jgi:hypothetical protein
MNSGSPDSPEQPAEDTEGRARFVARRVLAAWWQIALVSIAVYSAAVYHQHVLAQEATARAAQILAERRAISDSIQRRQEYVAKRRNECYDVYARERTRWSNAESPEYDLDEDVCRVRFKDNSSKKRDLLRTRELGRHRSFRAVRIEDVAPGLS